MSNLKLPSLKFQDLTDMREGKIAYATTLYKRPDSGEDSYVISHHGNAIANIYHAAVAITNAGYHSVSTRDRLHRILTDNGVNYRVNIIQGYMYATEILPGSITQPACVFVSSSALWFTRDEDTGLWFSHPSVNIYERPASTR